ncbi:MAG: T9SS type A sorting domain-containing protein [Ignavibacteriales bacterium]|nr:T9SS type A sorting domain-containing protein [Ignavibacteriales bacterium]
MKIFVIISIILFFSPMSLSQTNFWQQTNGPYDSGFILSFAKDSSGRILAGTANQGIYSSSNGGQSWNSIGLTGNDINCLAVTSNGFLFAGASNLYRSIDGGNNWNKTPLQSLGVQSLCVTGTGRIIVGTYYNGVYTSDDTGNTWINRTQQLGYCKALILYKLSNGTIFGSIAPACDYCTAINPSIYRSTDDGSTWQKVSDLPPTSFAEDGIGGVLAFVSQIPSVYVSTNNGDLWTPRSNYVYDMRNVSSSVISSTGILFTGTNNGGWGEVFRSTNHGTTWDVVASPPYTSGDVRALIIPDENCILAGNYYAGIFRSTDNGDTWIKSCTGIHSADIEAVFAVNANVVFCSLFSFTEETDIHRSTDGGQTWTKMEVGNSNTITRCFYRSINGDIYAGGEKVFKSTDTGNSWQLSSTGLNISSIFTITEGLSGTIFAGDYWGGIFRSTDRGSSWVAVNNGLTSLTIFSMISSPSGTLLAGSFNGQVFRSTNNGDFWTPISLGSNSVACLYRLMNGTILAGTSGIYKSTDDGLTWTGLGGTLAQQGIVSIVENPKGDLYVSTSYDGVYKSTDRGISWIQINSGLTDLRTQCMALSLSGSLYIGTWRHGLFKSVSNVNDVEETLLEPTKFFLAQNYPNPFNPSTLIRFQIPHSEFVTLKIFDLLGRELATLVNEDLNLGRYEKILNGGKLASGVYIYRIQAGSFVQTRKLLLIK